jgi:hypothetical protein
MSATPITTLSPRDKKYDSLHVVRGRRAAGKKNAFTLTHGYSFWKRYKPMFDDVVAKIDALRDTIAATAGFIEVSFNTPSSSAVCVDSDFPMGGDFVWTEEVQSVYALLREVTEHPEWIVEDSTDQLAAIAREDSHLALVTECLERGVSVFKTDGDPARTEALAEAKSLFAGAIARAEEQRLARRENYVAFLIERRGFTRENALVYIASINVGT